MAKPMNKKQKFDYLFSEILGDAHPFRAHGRWLSTSAWAFIRPLGNSGLMSARGPELTRGARHSMSATE